MSKQKGITLSRNWKGSCKEVSVKAVLHKKAIVCSDLGSLPKTKVRKEQNDDQAQ
ncbi:MAG: hypothetical protein GX580_15495 [Candidatus Hydrogenedens sp.]|nr:hypothetical protein [Candidatus Hydrogenedens sp.]